mmetsp:Transcript_16025/g.26637  ORF Transcript_16025/g.26637 Transcript_16025/m.26637 type:complete len:319 (+) Transcript_16025:2149-3105(+)
MLEGISASLQFLSPSQDSSRSISASQTSSAALSPDESLHFLLGVTTAALAGLPAAGLALLPAGSLLLNTDSILWPRGSLLLTAGSLLLTAGSAAASEFRATSPWTSNSGAVTPELLAAAAFAFLCLPLLSDRENESVAGAPPPRAVTSAAAGASAAREPLSFFLFLPFLRVPSDSCRSSSANRAAAAISVCSNLKHCACPASPTASHSLSGVCPCRSLELISAPAAKRLAMHSGCPLAAAAIKGVRRSGPHCASGRARDSSNNRAHATLPVSHARKRGVMPSLSGVSAGAPLASSSCTHSCLPSLHAKCTWYDVGREL